MLGLLDELWWRFWACPRTLESAARDFLLVRNGERIWAVLADPDSWYDFYVTDFKRRIAATYGLASDYNVHTTQVWSPGWNRRLLASAGPDPEQASERILQRVCDLARLGVSASPTEAVAETLAPADPARRLK
jgi:hypothetical protein